jgi:uncharacterized protein DUF4129
MSEPSFPSAIRLIEEALLLVRRAGTLTWLIYLSGVLPFFALLLFEVTDLLQNPFAGEHLMLIGFALATAYFWLHVCQSVFAARLYDTLTEQQGFLRPQFAAALRCQSVLAGSKLVLWPVALALVIPHAAVTMFYQHSFLPAEHGKGDWRATIAESRIDAVYRQSQTIWLLLLVFLLRAVLWINLVSLLFLMPALWKMFTGMENNVTRAPAVLWNPTSLVTLGVMAYLGLDPLVKAACVLRHFARQSEKSAQDLRLRSASLQRLTAVLLLGIFVVFTPVGAETRTGVSAEQMTDAVHAVFRDPANTWNLPVVEHRKRSVSSFEAFMDSVMDHANQTWTDLTTTIGKLLERLRKMFSSGNDLDRAKPSAMSADEATILLACFLGLLLVAVLFSLWNRRRRPKPELAAAAFEAAAPPAALADEAEAAEKSEDQWRGMAEQYRLNGDTRLAIRALYLSNLATLARGGIISLSRGKSNLDYLREAQRRGKRLGSELASLFRVNVQLFERSWYGAYPVTEETIEYVLRNSVALKNSISER